MGYGTKQNHCISEEALSHKVDQWKMRSQKAMGVFIDPITAEIVTKEPEIPELTVIAVLTIPKDPEIVVPTIGD